MMTHHSTHLIDIAVDLEYPATNYT